MTIIEPSSTTIGSDEVVNAPDYTITIIWERPWNRAVVGRSGRISISYRDGDLPPDYSQHFDHPSFYIHFENRVLWHNGVAVLKIIQESWSFDWHPLGILIGLRDCICLIRLRHSE